MKSFIKQSIRLFLPAIVLLSTISAIEQDARLPLERLKGLEDKAEETVEINVESKLLNVAWALVKRKRKDKDTQAIGKVINGLEAVYVRVYNFKKENEYNMADVDAIRAHVQNPGWEKVAKVRSKKKNQKLDVYTMFIGENISGVAVIISETKKVVVVNVIGPIDIDTLAELGRQLNIPEIEGIKKIGN